MKVYYFVFYLIPMMIWLLYYLIYTTVKQKVMDDPKEFLNTEVFRNLQK